MPDTPNTIEVSREYCEEIGAMIIALVSTHLRRTGAAHVDSLIEEVEEEVASRMSTGDARGLWVGLGSFALRTAGASPLICRMIDSMLSIGEEDA